MAAYAYLAQLDQSPASRRAMDRSSRYD